MCSFDYDLSQKILGWQITQSWKSSGSNNSDLVNTLFCCLLRLCTRSWFGLAGGPCMEFWKDDPKTTASECLHWILNNLLWKGIWKSSFFCKQGLLKSRWTYDGAANHIFSCAIIKMWLSHCLQYISSLLGFSENFPWMYFNDCASKIYNIHTCIWPKW